MAVPSIFSPRFPGHPNSIPHPTLGRVGDVRRSTGTERLEGPAVPFDIRQVTAGVAIGLTSGLG